ncbi:MAG: diaminopimelate epimerase [Gudongella sp.]|nr:diaminopimelate epimerase [Gudongella sp.]
MQLKFVKINPCENMTVFILDEIPRDMHSKVAKKLMGYGSIYAEQVGFIEKSEDIYRVQMMGGEFCGNASRGFASYMVYKNYPGIKKTDTVYNVPLEVSGLEKILNCKVSEGLSPNTFFAKIEMPLPIDHKSTKINYKDRELSLFRVNFEGISHFIVDAQSINDKLNFFNQLKASIQDANLEAFGVMFYNKNTNYIEPLVYVRDTDTTCFERSCASGTAALGVSLAFESSQSQTLKIGQPGGSLEVSVECRDNKIHHIELGGEIEIVAEGTVIV